MENILSYAESEFRTFQDVPFHEVDSLILSWLSYIQWPISADKCSKEYTYSVYDMFRAECFSDMFAHIKDKESTKQLLTAVTSSPRYRNIRIWCYEAQTNLEQEMQFAAVTFLLPSDNQIYVAYRGTDSTFVGWKEDLNMAFQYPIPAQESAAQYLTEICRNTDARIIVGGHSKGGNLAIYAAAHNIKDLDRIEKIYSHDGPGFLEEVIESEAFQLIREKIEKTVPQSSMIGMMLEQHGEYQIIQSNEKSFWQHNPFTWCIEDGRFCRMSELTADAVIVNRAVHSWLATISKEERERFVDAIYSLTENVEVDNFLDFGKNIQMNLRKILDSFKISDKETRDFMLQTLQSLVMSYIKTIPDGVIKSRRDDGN